MKRFHQPLVSMLLCSCGIFLSFSIAAINAFGQLPSAEPAPVPGAVAIARPTAEEVQLAERSLAKFLETADPAVKAVNQKYPGLIAVRVPPPILRSFQASLHSSKASIKPILNWQNRETLSFCSWEIQSPTCGATKKETWQASRCLTNTLAA